MGNIILIIFIFLFFLPVYFLVKYTIIELTGVGPAERHMALMSKLNEDPIQKEIDAIYSKIDRLREAQDIVESDEEFGALEAQINKLYDQLEIEYGETH